MTKKNGGVHLIPLIKQAVNTYFSHPLILLPFITSAFIQLLLLEVLFFAPRFPLAVFFGPLIEKLWGNPYLHYPFNLVILPKLFQYGQIPLYIFVNSFLVAVAIMILAAINNNQKITFKTAVKKTLPRYVHVVVGTMIAFSIFYGLTRVYGLVFARALQINSTTGIFYFIKMTVIDGAPYFNLILGAIVTAVFAFVTPLIVIEQKGVFSAIMTNFKMLWRSFFFILFMVMIPTLFYLPVILLRNNINLLADTIFPEMRFMVLAFSILVMIFIDASIYTSITIYYFLKREK